MLEWCHGDTAGHRYIQPRKDIEAATSVTVNIEAAAQRSQEGCTEMSRRLADWVEPCQSPASSIACGRTACPTLAMHIAASVTSSLPMLLFTHY